MAQKVVWVVQDIQSVAEEISSFIERRFGDKVRVVRVVNKNIFPIPDPRDLCARDRDAIPDILVSDLISTYQLARYKPRDLFEQIVGGAFDDRFGNIATLAYFAKRHNIKHVAVVSRCFNWFSGHRDVSQAEADSWQGQIKKQLCKHGITAQIHKSWWTTEREALQEFVAKALEN